MKSGKVDEVGAVRNSLLLSWLSENKDISMTNDDWIFLLKFLSDSHGNEYWNKEVQKVYNYLKNIMVGEESSLK